MGPTLFWFAVGIGVLISALWTLPPVQAKIPTKEGEEPYHGKWGSAIGRAIGGVICLSIAVHSIPLSEEEQARIDAECRSSLDCWRDEHFFSAENACADALEGRAKYDFQWIDKMGENKLDKRLARWEDQEKGYITYFGDKLRLQNGFGAFQTVLYQCDYDPANRRVLNTRIATAEEGIMKLYVDE